MSLFQAGDALTFQVITQSAFRGARLYAWNPYNPAGPNVFSRETARNDVTDASIRVWRPSDGASLWVNSGQCDVRKQSLVLTAAPLEVLYRAKQAGPTCIVLTDLVEKSNFR